MLARAGEARRGALDRGAAKKIAVAARTSRAAATPPAPSYYASSVLIKPENTFPGLYSALP